jgi:hypothetical protein
MSMGMALHNSAFLSTLEEEKVSWSHRKFKGTQLPLKQVYWLFVQVPVALGAWQLLN